MASVSMLSITKNFSALCIHSSWSICLRPISHKAVLEKLQLPEKPKRPLGAFLSFVNGRREELLKRQPNLSAREVTTELGKQWHDLSEDEREKYKEKHREEYKKYKEELKKYNESVTEEQLMEINEAVSEVTASKEKNLLKKMRRDKLREFKRPKNPTNAFSRFLQDHDRGNKTIPEFWKEMAEKWKNLSQKEKQKYVTEYEKDRKQFLQELEKWEEEMILKGNLDIVRTSTIQKRFKNLKSKTSN